MGVPTIKTGPMTVGEFYAFTDTRPDEEKWELIDGEPILNASPSDFHQKILLEPQHSSGSDRTGDNRSRGRLFRASGLGYPT